MNTYVHKFTVLHNISSLGAKTIPSPLVAEFGFDYHANPGYKALSKEEQERLQQEARKDNEQDLSIYTTAYHRNRGEELNQMHCKSFQDVIDQQGGMIEYVYVATRKKDGSLCWYVKSYDHFGILEDILLEKHLI